MNTKTCGPYYSDHIIYYNMLPQMPCGGFSADGYIYLNENTEVYYTWNIYYTWNVYYNMFQKKKRTRPSENATVIVRPIARSSTSSRDQ